MPITIKDVAAKAGVSVSTASRIMGGYGYSSDKARKKVQAASKELGYRPNLIAKSMVKRRTKTIGLLVTDIANPFFLSLIDSVESNARKYGYNILLSNTDESGQEEVDAVLAMVERRVDGLLIVPACDICSGTSKRRFIHYKELRNQGIPFVFMDRSVDGIRADSIVFENYEPAYEATKRLITEGYHRIAIVSPNQKINTIEDRRSGFFAAVQEAGSAIESFSVICGYKPESVTESLQDFLNHGAPDAILTLDYQMTIGTMAALHRKKIEGTRIIGFDEIGIIESLFPFRLSTIRQPIDEMARIATQILVDSIEHPSDKDGVKTITLQMQEVV